MIKLVFAGHTNRGGEIIKLLEMLGGKNTCGCKNTFTSFYYYIDDDKEIVATDIPPANSMVYLLEDFEKEYPYKVGDDVLAYAEGWFAKFTIQDIRWNYELNRVEYKICSSWCDTSLIQPYKEEPIECSDKRHKGNCTIGYIQELGSRDMELIIPSPYQVKSRFISEIESDLIVGNNKYSWCSDESGYWVYYYKSDDYYVPIKYFPFDNDKEYAKLCAEELIEKLNESF